MVEKIAFILFLFLVQALADLGDHDISIKNLELGFELREKIEGLWTKISEDQDTTKNSVFNDEYSMFRWFTAFGNIDEAAKRMKEAAENIHKHQFENIFKKESGKKEITYQDVPEFFGHFNDTKLKQDNLKNEEREKDLAKNSIEEIKAVLEKEFPSSVGKEIGGIINISPRQLELEENANGVGISEDGKRVEKHLSRSVVTVLRVKEVIELLKDDKNGENEKWLTNYMYLQSVLVYQLVRNLEQQHKPKNPYGVILIVDLRDAMFGISNFFQIRNMIEAMQGSFSELSKKIIVHNSGTIFSWIYDLLKTLMSERTQNKVKLSGEKTDLITELLGLKNTPEEYGGSLKSHNDQKEKKKLSQS